ncbi:MAG: DUF429 domain-containing protein [Aquificaceae bacterium]
MKGLERILGLDLSGSPKRRSGYAYLRGGSLKVGVLYKDEEILELAMGFNLVMMDAPLSLPFGRRSIEERGPHLRECDLMLRREGHKFFPITLGPMRLLTERGIRLARVMRSFGIEVLETFPGATYDILGIRRRDREAILKLYRCLPIKLEERKYCQDELDAIACWLAGVCYILGITKVFTGKDGSIVVVGEDFKGGFYDLDHP